MPPCVIRYRAVVWIVPLESDTWHSRVSGAAGNLENASNPSEVSLEIELRWGVWVVVTPPGPCARGPTWLSSAIHSVRTGNRKQSVRTDVPGKFAAAVRRIARVLAYFARRGSGQRRSSTRAGRPRAGRVYRRGGRARPPRPPGPAARASRARSPARSRRPGSSRLCGSRRRKAPAAARTRGHL